MANTTQISYLLLRAFSASEVSSLAPATHSTMNVGLRFSSSLSLSALSLHCFCQPAKFAEEIVSLCCGCENASNDWHKPKIDKQAASLNVMMPCKRKCDLIGSRRSSDCSNSEICSLRLFLRAHSNGSYNPPWAVNKTTVFCIWVGIPSPRHPKQPRLREENI